jgi:hypothetical protein
LICLKLDHVITTPSVTIPNRFNGPAGSANGGYACGLLAGAIDGPAQVILRRPPPLGVELLIERAEDGVALQRGDTTIAIGTPTNVELECPKPPTFAEAEEASQRYGGFIRHPFPTCFVCGARRSIGDGLRIFPGRVSDASLIAAPWIPHKDLADGHGKVRPEFVWAALDCPTGWVAMHMSPDEQVVVLGTFAVDHRRPLQAGSRYVIGAWPLGSERRKFFTGAALWSYEGDLHAVARATWIQVSGQVWSG